MKNLLVLFVFFALSGNLAFSQSRGGSSYSTAAGLRVDFGTGWTGVGPNIKHFFNSHDAIDASLLFYDHAIGIGGEYQYNGPITGAAGLKWYAGLGPQIVFATWENGPTYLYLNPVVGLDYKITGAPIDLAFDWRPAFRLTQGTDFTAGRFGLSARFTF
ncbi:hypothetical protein GS399_08685 [Pedobacter sp. HMF7647]|uniref:Outer membrane beta-barrel protein n=1 Tax=Hufsiella arboris TaxID=2695275 RepID=A0A7K1Y8W3_9SPHI|nr:hypothetical protein [Hufsiella arboris]